MKKLLVFGAALAFATAGMAAMKETNGHWVNELPTKARAASPFQRGNNQITYHGGDILNAAHVVPIYWGTYWGSGTGPTERNAMNSFFQQFGTNSHYGVITQYYDTTTGTTRHIALSTLLNNGGDWYDSSAPPTNVTDSVVQGEVNKYLSSHTFDNEAIYEVFIPPTSYSSDGTSTSCGGPHLAYCAYHGAYSSGGRTMFDRAYPSCSGCHPRLDGQDAQHFACHETRER
jgi:hypothetical protein